MQAVVPTVSGSIKEISPVDALWVLIQSQTKSVRKVLIQRLLAEETETAAQKSMLADSLTQAFEELHSGKAKPDARNLFVQ